MENASKALIMAGGILLAVLILGLLMYMWTSVGDYTTQAEEQKKKEQLVTFNKQYEAYQRQLLRGNDIASVINKIRDNNRIYAGEADLQMTWQFILKRGIVGTLPAGTYQESNSSAYNSVVNDDTDFKAFKNLYFRCKAIEYSKKTGKVNKMVFEELLVEEM